MSVGRRDDGAMDDALADQVVQRYADAWARNDVGEMVAIYHPEVVAHYGGTSEFAGTHAGRERFVEVLVESSVRSERTLVGIDAVFQDGDRGAIFAREAMTIDGARAEVARALRYRIEHGLIAECWLYDHDQHLVDRAWSA